MSLRLILVGFGNVGRGFLRVLNEKRETLERKHDLEISLVAVIRRRGVLVDENGLRISELLERESELRWIDENPLDVIREIDADVLVECSPTNVETGEPGLSYIYTALESGKHVITSNKGPLAVDFWGLKKAAARRGLELRFEATVGGAIPIFSTLRSSLRGDEIISIRGILNGTTNYILSRMCKEGLSLELVLREAQELGIAESDPTYDIEAIDPAAKLVILANEILGMDARFQDVKRIGISRITAEAARMAMKHGYKIKLIAIAEEERLEVSPRLIPQGHPMDVDGTLNVISLKTDLAREITLVGPGAGPRETASALINDLIDVSLAVRS